MKLPSSSSSQCLNIAPTFLRVHAETGEQMKGCILECIGPADPLGILSRAQHTAERCLGSHTSVLPPRHSLPTCPSPSFMGEFSAPHAHQLFSLPHSVQSPSQKDTACTSYTLFALSYVVRIHTDLAKKTPPRKNLLGKQLLNISKTATTRKRVIGLLGNLNPSL